MSQNSIRKPSATMTKKALSASNYLHIRMSDRMAGIVAAVGATSKGSPERPEKPASKKKSAA